MNEANSLKLFMLLLGSKAKQRNVEQHDYFFGIAANLKELVPEIKAFWPEAGDSIHIDGWREVNKVENFSIRVVLQKDTSIQHNLKKLFFINLGGYQENKLEEQHYTVLTVQEDRTQAILYAKQTVFFKTNTLKGSANSHIDEKYGIDVDDIYRIEDILTPQQKAKYHIQIEPSLNQEEDKVHLGYLRLHKII